jgi:hypothetical protein
MTLRHSGVGTVQTGRRQTVWREKIITTIVWYEDDSIVPKLPKQKELPLHPNFNEAGNRLDG